MRPFREPDKVAFEPLTNCFVDKKEAAENRSNEFWGELEESHFAKVFDDPHYSRNSIKKDILRLPETVNCRAFQWYGEVHSSLGLVGRNDL